MENKIKQMYVKIILQYCFLFLSFGQSQTFFPSDPYHLLQYERAEFDSDRPKTSSLFRPIHYVSDTSSFSLILRNEGYFNDNVPNQENMDVRYFSKGIGSFHSLELSFNSPYFTFIVEPYIINKNFLPVDSINRQGFFSVLNDITLNNQDDYQSSNFRNLFAFLNYNGLGFGVHYGNRWWGSGIHTSLQMTNNTTPFMGQIIGTLREIRIGDFGFYGLYTFVKMNKLTGKEAKYYTALNGQLTWYGPLILSIGFSRNYLTGGSLKTNYYWTEQDAKKIVFEGLLTSNLIDLEYTIGGHDPWDQTLSTYLTVTMPKRNIKVYFEAGFNDNRMFFADFLSQPDHSLASIIGIRDYGIGDNNNLIWGFEWANLMITYTSRHRPGGTGTWYSTKLYDYSSYNGRRWGAHSGSDSDDWYLYAGYLSEKFMFVPALNYERHGIVTHRPAEVKIEFRVDARYKYKDIWFGIYYERQFEAFLGFPDYFYEDDYGNPIDSSEGTLANGRHTNTIVFSLNRTFNF